MKKILLTLLFNIVAVLALGQTRYRIDFRTSMYRYAGTNSLEALWNMKSIDQLDKTDVSGRIDMFNESISITYYDDQNIKRITSISIPHDRITKYRETKDGLDYEYNNGQVHVEINGSSVLISRSTSGIKYVWWGFIK